MATRKLEVVFAGDTRSFQASMSRAGDATDKTSQRMNRLRNAAKVAMVGGIALLGKGLKDSVGAAVEAEKSQAKMEAQLRASGISFAKHGGEIDAVIQKHSKLAGIDDEELQGAFTNIVRATGDVSKSMKLMGLVTDFARAKNIDAAKAGEIIAKVAGGNTGVLGRYGIKVKEGATATEALGLLQEKFKGQAEAYGKTTAGAQDRFKVATENLQEAIGGKLLPQLTKLANHAANAAGWLEKNTIVAKILGGVLAGTAIVLGTVAVGTKVVAAAQAVATAAQWALNAAMTANPIGLVVVALVALGAGLVIAYKKSETFRRIVSGAWDAVKKGAQLLVTVVTTIFKAWKTTLTTVTNAMRTGVVRSWQALRDGVLGVARGVRDRATAIFRSARDTLLAVVSNLRERAIALWRAMRDTVVGVADNLRDRAVTQFRRLREGLSNALRGALDFARGVVDNFRAAGERIGTAISGGIRSAADNVVGYIRSVLNGVINFMNRAIRAFNRLPKVKIGEVPNLATGGTVRASGVYRVGELGPETVYLPRGATVTQASQSRDAGRPISLTVNNYGDRLNEHAIAARLGWQLATR